MFLDPAHEQKVSIKRTWSEEEGIFPEFVFYYLDGGDSAFCNKVWSRLSLRI